MAQHTISKYRRSLQADDFDLPVPDDKLQNVASRARQLYYQRFELFCPRQWRERPAKWPLSHHNRAEQLKWRKITAKLIVMLIDPGRYIVDQFQSEGEEEPSMPISPEQLLSPKRLKAYRASLRTNAHLKQTASEFREMQAETRRHVRCMQSLDGATMENACVDAITDPDLSLTWLFRFCLARSLDRAIFDRLAASYEREAAFEYMWDREAYDKLWKLWLPEEFRKQVAEIYKQYFDIVTF